MILKYLLFTLIVFFFSSLSFPQRAIAATTSGCKETKPATAPVLTQAIPGNNSITLTWTEGQDPVTHYLLAYGTSKNTLIYGAQNIGPKGTTTYTVDHLKNGTRYYFRVNAVNKCRLKASNTLSGVAGGDINSTGENPKLSLYKPVLGSSPSSQIFDDHEQKGAAVPTANTNEEKCTSNCSGDYLLLIEVVALLTFFVFIYKYPSIKPITSIVIPLLLALLFYKLDRVCPSPNFFCKYFYILDITIFILMISFQKQRLIHKAMGETKI